MIKINNIKDKPVDVYYNDQKIGTIDSQYDYLDIRLQVASQKLEGVYFLFDNQRIDVNTRGECSSYPKGFFDTTENQLYDILNWKRNERNSI